MTPEQLSTVIVRALTALSERGAVSLPDGVPASVVVERPRSKEHGELLKCNYKETSFLFINSKFFKNYNHAKNSNQKKSGIRNAGKCRTSKSNGGFLSKSIHDDTK